MADSNGNGKSPDSGSSWATALGAQGLEAEFGQLSHATEEDDTVVRADQSSVDGSDASGEGEDTLQDSLETGAGTSASTKPEATQKTSGEKEVITVTDETGRKRKIEIDYSNREQIKKMVAQAAGMRKFQAERDTAIKSRAALEAKLAERETDWANLEQAFSKGHKHLIDTLSGKAGAFEELVEQEIRKREFLQNASPEEIKQAEQQEAFKRTQSELDKIRKENEEFKKSVQKEREEAEIANVQSKLNPLFDKYRFAGKLGDAQDEQVFDEMLWESSLKRMGQYEEKGIELTPELMERELRAVSSVLSKRIGSLAERKANNVVAQKKQEATENVQANLKAGYSSNSDREKLNKAIKSGDTGNIFKNWATFSQILNNKK
jgi:hypothetical protein